MIDSLLLYARAGRQEAQLETFDLAELLSEILDSIAPPESFTHQDPATVTNAYDQTRIVEPSFCQLN